MTEIMQSIKPKWCELIISGKKTIEVRKTRPKCDTPFKVYIYCTKAKPSDVGKIPDVDCWSGKVIGEYVCDRIYRAQRESLYVYIGYNAEWGNEDCLTPAQLLDYGGFNVWLYGWHISDLQIYDTPKDIREFGLKRAPQDWCYVHRID